VNNTRTKKGSIMK